jgi:hypothetical protein
LADADYPEWLWTLDVEVPREVEELDPERDGWRYWEAWDRRRQEQTQRLDHLIYRYIHLQVFILRFLKALSGSNQDKS